MPVSHLETGIFIDDSFAIIELVNHLQESH